MSYSDFQLWYKELLSKYHLTGTLKARTKDDHVIMMEDIYEACKADTKLCMLFYISLKNSKNKMDLYKRYKTFVRTYEYANLKGKH